MDFYKNNALDYINSTFNCDMSKQYEIFIKHLGNSKVILDLGCGSGRDSLYFKNNGYIVHALDLENKFCDNAKKLGIEHVYNMDINDINFINMFDAIWASASLLHIKSNMLNGVLKRLSNALKSDGILYASFKLGDFEGLRDDRYYNDMNLDKINKYLNSTNLKLIHSEITLDVRYNNETKWINFIFKKC